MPPPRRPEQLRGRVFRKRDVLSRGLLTAGELRSSAWRRLFRGVYADAALPLTVGLRVTGAALLCPPGAVFSGRTAAHLLGATALADVGMPVEVTVDPAGRFGPVTGLRIRQAALAPGDVVRVGSRRCTSPVRTALDIARTEPLLDAVPALDVLLADGVVAHPELRQAAADLGGARGSRRAGRAVELADLRAESPPESRVRVLLALGGLAPVPQFVVRDAAGGFVARVDLAFPDARLAVEYDGAWHAEPGQFAKDRRRLDRLVAIGWTVLHVTAADLRDPVALVARIRAAYRRCTIGEGAR
ncbi:DUF559 domain-containing protein [Blastococcus xanthinilyticus]|uniref:Very-short-patch-repair endonuclease n=1 Tax=Blastococcus xanthinilyticus TaxID=1564164 RepID=A0A5S5D1A5_9ACTN|nr:DUF559 domain-containing protein [Blastococcus xanthinilyticus]TYP89791.1 very-short-patch-repair endonuclease [Blastococcus xanthinilyticus]